MIRWSGHTPHAYLLGVRPVSNLIDNPNLFALIAAVLAGIVGVVSLTEARSAALIGVFISVTTIPAAADAGLSIAYANWTEAAVSAPVLGQPVSRAGRPSRGRQGGPWRHMPAQCRASGLPVSSGPGDLARDFEDDETLSQAAHHPRQVIRRSVGRADPYSVRNTHGS
jgi:hypothetical protein